MAKNTTAYFYKDMVSDGGKIVSSDGTNKVVIATGQADGSRIMTIMVTSDDPTARTINLYYNNGAEDILFYQFSVPGGAGQSGAVPAINLIQNSSIPKLLYDAQGNFYFNLPAAKQLKAAVSTGAVTATKTIWFTVDRVDF